MLGQVLGTNGMFHLLKSRTSIDLFRTEKCKVTFGLKYTFIIGEGDGRNGTARCFPRFKPKKGKKLIFLCINCV